MLLAFRLLLFLWQLYFYLKIKWVFTVTLVNQTYTVPMHAQIPPTADRIAVGIGGYGIRGCGICGYGGPTVLASLPISMFLSQCLYLLKIFQLGKAPEFKLKVTSYTWGLTHFVGYLVWKTEEVVPTVALAWCVWVPARRKPGRRSAVRLRGPAGLWSRLFGSPLPRHFIHHGQNR